MPSNHPWVCVPCRYVARQTNTCPHCGAEMVSRHYSWRAPRRTNDAAWKLIEAGVWLWDRKRVERFKIPWPVTGTKERRGGRIHSPRLP